MNYYNEFDPKAAAWLLELIKQGHIPAGEVDTRSIIEVSPNDLKGFTQCHFFAGIGGWPLALALAGVDATRPLWSGSCPCQPFSVAGKGLGKKDERHLWPAFARLIAQCAPPIVFGEQVASAAGRGWLHGVRADLEGMGYAVGAADLCAAGVGAPHIRQRLYWVADATSDRRAQQLGESRGRARRGAPAPDPAECPGSSGVGDTDGAGWALGVRNAGNDGQAPRTPAWKASEQAGAWDSFDLIHCTDGKTRRIESGTFPLAHGIPGRVGLLRGYGNAIVPQVAAAFIAAVCGIVRGSATCVDKS